MVIKKLSAKLKSDFAIVMVANLLSYTIAFSSSVIYVRILGKAEFGIYTFAFGIVSLFLLLNGFGAASGVLQYVSKSRYDPKLQLAYLRFAFISGGLFNLIISGLIILYALFIPLPLAGAKEALLLMSFFPIGRLYIDIFQAYLRATEQNKLQARFLIINNIILLLICLVGVLLFKLNGLIYFTYIGYVVMYLVSIFILKLPIINQSTDSVSIDRREFINYSFFTTLSNAFSGLLFVLDTIIIGYVVKDAKLLAVYKVATIIPFAINFIPNIAVNYFYPQFVQYSHNSDKIRQLARFVSIRMFAFSASVSLFLIVSARPLITLIFGHDYQDSILPFQIISFGYWIISTFRTVNGNILAAMGKAKLSFYITSIMLVVNVLITYLMVLNYSIVGAASAIIIMYTLSSLFGYVALKFILRDLKND